MEDLNDDTAIPDVLGCVQEILSTIFVSMYNHHDAEERCFSDCLAELPEYDTVEDKKVLSSFSIVDTRDKHTSTEMQYFILIILNTGPRSKFRSHQTTTGSLSIQKVGPFST